MSNLICVPRVNGSFQHFEIKFRAKETFLSPEPRILCLRMIRGSGLFTKTNERTLCFRVPQSSSLPQLCAKEKLSGVEIGLKNSRASGESAPKFRASALACHVMLMFNPMC